MMKFTCICGTQGQNVVELIVEPHNSVYITYLAISFSFKFLDVVHVVVRQSVVDVFLLDWERPESRPQTSNTVSNVASGLISYLIEAVESCPVTKLNGGLSRLHSADEDTVSWLTSCGSWHAYKKKTNWDWRSNLIVHSVCFCVILLVALLRK